MKKLLVQTLTLVCFTITTVHALEREELGATLYQDSLFAILYRDATPDNRLYWVVYDSEGEQIQERVLSRYDALYTLSYYESNGTRALLVSKEQPDPSPILNSAILLGDDLFPKDTIELPLGEIVEIVPHTTGIVSVTKEPKTIAHGYAA